MVGTAMIAAVGYLLMFFSFPLIPAFPFMKLDFSDIPILLGTYLFGPGAGVAAALLRSVLHFLTTGGDLGSLIGNVTSFISALCYVLPVYYLTRHNQSKKQLVLGLGVSTLTLTTVMSILNYFVVLPLYLLVMNFSVGMAYSKYVMVGVIPFNLLKGLILSVVFVIVHGKLLPWLASKEKMKLIN